VSFVKWKAHPDRDRVRCAVAHYDSLLRRVVGEGTSNAVGGCFVL